MNDFPILRSDRFNATQAEMNALEASLLFLDAAAHGNVTETQPSPSEEEPPADLYTCPECKGSGEQVYLLSRDPQDVEYTVCAYCHGTGAVSY